MGKIVIPKHSADVEEMNAVLNGRGGGKPFFVQGSVQASEKEVRAFFENK